MWKFPFDSFVISYFCSFRLISFCFFPPYAAPSIAFRTDKESLVQRLEMASNSYEALDGFSGYVG